MPDSALTKWTRRRGISFYLVNLRTVTFAVFCLLVVCPGYASQASGPQTSFTLGEINGDKLGMSYTQFIAKHPEQKKYCRAGSEACGRLSSYLGMEAFLVVYFLDDQVYEISYSSRSESFGSRVLAELTKLMVSLNAMKAKNAFVRGRTVKRPSNTTSRPSMEPPLTS